MTLSELRTLLDDLENSQSELDTIRHQLQTQRNGNRHMTREQLTLLFRALETARLALENALEEYASEIDDAEGANEDEYTSTCIALDYIQSDVEGIIVEAAGHVDVQLGDE